MAIAQLLKIEIKFNPIM